MTVPVGRPVRERCGCIWTASPHGTPGYFSPAIAGGHPSLILSALTALWRDAKADRDKPDRRRGCVPCPQQLPRRPSGRRQVLDFPFQKL